MSEARQTADALNEALVSSRPISVLDVLENYWEKNDASRGVNKRGILAEHLMEKQTQDLKDGKNGTQGRGAFCV